MIRRAVQWVLIAAVVAAAAAYAVTVLTPLEYEARATLLWVASQADADPAGDAVSGARYVAAPLSVGTYADMATSEPVLARAFEPAGDEPASDEAIARSYAGAVSVDVVDEDRSALLHLRVRAADPNAAAERAADLADALIAWDVDRARREVQSGRDAIVRQIDELTRELNEVSFQQAQALGIVIEDRREELAHLRALAASASSPLTLVRRPPPPERPAGRSPLEMAIVAGTLAGLAALGAVLLISAMRAEAAA